MKHFFKRFLSLMLAFVLAASCVPASVFAAGTEQTLNNATEVVYDFDLAGNYTDTFTGSGNFSVEDQLTDIQSLYTASTINWTFEAKQNGSTDAAGNTPTDASFTRNQFYKGSGLRIYTSGYNWWYALRLKAPGTGNYNVTVNTYLASGKHSMWTEAYLFDASLVTGSATIDFLLTESNQLSDFAPTSADPDADLGSFAFTAGKEYILVLRQTSDTRVAANGDGLRTNNLYLGGITMGIVSDTPEETTTPDETTTVPGETTDPDAPTIAPEETTVVPAPNLITNGTFSEIRNISYYTSTKTLELGWNYSGTASMQIEATDAHTLDGAYSLHVTHGENAASSSVYQVIQVPAYTADETRFKLSVNAQGTVDAEGCYICVLFRDDEQAVGNTVKSYTTYLNSSNTWQEYVAEGVIPAGVKSARIFVAYFKTNTKADLYFDKVSLTIGDSEIPLTNASFDDLPDGTTASVEESVFCLNSEGWIPGNSQYGTASAAVDPADIFNGVLKISDTSADVDNGDGTATAGKYPTVYYGGFPIEAGASYTFSLKYKVADGSEGLTVTAYLRGNADDSSGIELFTGSLDDATAGWKTAKWTIDNVPVGVETFYVKLATSSSMAGTMYFDNVSLTRNCAEHIWGEAQVTAATCTEKGTSVAICSECGATQKSIFSALGHNFTGDTCSRCGEVCSHTDVDKGVCNNCGKEIPEQIVANNLITNGSFQSAEMNPDSTGWKLSQSYVALEEDASGNPTTNGILVHKDTDTGKGASAKFYPEVEAGATYQLSFKCKYISGIQPTIHVKQYYQDDTGATKTEDATFSTGINTAWSDIGPMEFTMRADMTKLEIYPNTGVAATGESYFDDFVLVKVCDAHNFQNPVTSEASCSQGAVRTVTCSKCGAMGTTVVGEPKGHQWDAGVIDPDLSDSEDTVTVYTCTVCGTTKAVMTHANGHRHNAVVTAPTCDTAGYTTYTCECGDSYKDDYVDATGHSYENGKCSICKRNLQFKLLLIGNSYTRDAANYGQGMTNSQLLDILQAMLGEHAEITLGLATAGGKSMNWHATQAYHNSPNYSFALISTAHPAWLNISTYGYTSADALSYTDWDAVSLQPYLLDIATGREPVYYPEETDERFYDFEIATEYMLDYVAQYASDADVYLYMHWARSMVTELNTGLSEYNESAAFMPQVLAYAGTESGNQFKTIIPVGLSIQNARTTYLSLLQYNTESEEFDLEDDVQIGLQRDTGHLSLNVGRYIASLTFAETMIPADMRAEGYVLPDIRITESVGELPKEYTEIAQKAVFAAVNGWKNGSLAVTNIEGYTQDPTVAASETLSAMSLTLDSGSADTYSEQIRAAVLAALPAGFAVDTSVVNTDTNTASVTIRFGYTSATVEMEIVYAHSWNEGEVTTEATKETTGIMTYTCTVCGEQKTEVIPQTLRFSGATLTLMSNVQVNFNVSRATLDTYGYTDLYAVFTYVNRDNKLITVTLTEYRQTEKYYVFDFNELAPDLFGNTITATLYAKNNGKDYTSKTAEYSVLQYCNKQLPSAANNVEFRTLLVDLLNYGAAAQMYTGYKTDALVNAGLTEEQKSWGSTATGGYVSHHAITGDVEAPLAAWKGGALVLEDAVTMTVTIEAANLEGLSVKVNCGEFEFNYDCVVDPEAEEQIFVPTERENRYKLIINELPIYTMREPVYITVYKDGVPASKLLTYSVESYAASKYGGSDANLNNLIDAIMRYGDAAKAYVTALGTK